MNNRIQFWRIVMTYVIATYHFNKNYSINTSGYIAVEFFFIVSGYFLASKYFRLKDAGNNMNSIKYTLNRYKRFFPYSAVAFFTALLGIGIIHSYSLKEYLTGIFKHLPELFLTNMLGFKTSVGISYNDLTWYLSVLLIIGFIIWTLLRYAEKIYIYAIVGLTSNIILKCVYSSNLLFSKHSI